MTGIGLVGTGYWGKNHARNWKEMLNEGIIDKLVFCDIDIERAKELAGEGVGYTDNYQELLDDPDIHGIDIVTPSNTHYPIGKEALYAGKDIFVEKPLTMDFKEAEEIVKIAEEEKRIIGVGHIFRYHPGIQEVKRMIDSGELGKIYYMFTNRMAYASPRKDMGVMYALGVHELDLYCYLLGVKYPRNAKITKGTYLQTGIEEFADILMEFDDNISGYAIESWMSPFDKKMRVFTIIGSEKSVRVDYMKHDEIEVFNGKIMGDLGNHNDPVVVDGEVEIVKLEKKEPLRAELMDFVSCVQTGKQPLSDMYSGKRAVEMVEKCLNNQCFRPE